MPLSFSTLFLSISLALQLYLFLRLRGYVRDEIKRPLLRRTILFGAAAFLTLMLALLACHALLGGWAGWPPLNALYDAAHIWGIGSMGCAAVLFIHSLFCGANPFCARRLRPPQPDLGRRQFLQQSAGLVAAAPFVLSGYGVAVERWQFDIDHFTVPIQGLSSALSGFSVVQLTDIHFGPFMTAEELAAFVEAANRRGVGISALPVRINCAPQIAHLTLKKA